jgi:hypothetical protein
MGENRVAIMDMPVRAVRVGKIEGDGAVPVTFYVKEEDLPLLSDGVVKMQIKVQLCA